MPIRPLFLLQSMCMYNLNVRTSLPYSMPIPVQTYMGDMETCLVGSSLFCCILVFVLLTRLVPDQELAKKNVFKRLPCLPKYIREENIFIFLEDYKWTFIIFVTAGLAIAISEISFFAGYLIWNIYEQFKENKMSKKTYQMQRRFFFALIVQVTIPFIFFFGPAFVLGIATVNDYYNQTLNNQALIIVSCHGFISTIVMIIAHRPYREVLLNWIIHNRFTLKKVDSPQESAFVVVKRGSIRPIV
uniref:Serpentine Receptor, class H n=2 Tax=Caenorhabditis tropicalis TaxID=1561998 RepID=A0A1I7UX04_9PELO